MNLLFVSNLYPPHHLGGYEQLCHEVASRLQARGHAVHVLTSTFGVQQPQSAPGIDRELQLESDVYYYRPQQILRFRTIQSHNRQAVAHALQTIKPEAVILWGMWKLSKQVAQQLEEPTAPPLAYYLASEWPNEPSAHEEYWDTPANTLIGRLFKRSLRGTTRAMLQSEWRPYPLRYQNVMTCSAAVRDNLVAAHVPIEHAKVVYHGIDPEVYSITAEHAANQSSDSLKVVFVGSLVPHKGTHTIIEAIGHILENTPDAPITLDILGKGHPDYEAKLHDMVKQWRLDSIVTFHDPIAREQLPEFLANFNTLVLSSIWAEPLARISQEAMAARLALVGTLTGGTTEILEDGINGLGFPPDDAQALAQQLIRLMNEPALRRQLAAAGWKTVTERFTMTRMLEELEAYLNQLVADRRVPGK